MQLAPERAAGLLPRARPVGGALAPVAACARLSSRRSTRVRAANFSAQGALSVGSESSALPEVAAPLAAAAAQLEQQQATTPSAGGAPQPVAQQPLEQAPPPPQLSQQQHPDSGQGEAAPKPSSNFINRVIFGCLLGFGGAAIVFAGGLPYLAAALFVVYQATQEFYGMLTSKDVSKGLRPPSSSVSAATTALCLSITAFTYFSHGRSGAAMSVAAFCLLVMNILAERKPKFSQLSASVFGLFYCGYLPSFWIKLRNLDIAGPALWLPGASSEVLASISSALPALTVGLVATLTSVACIIAADTGAYFVGKNLGRTKLTDISPKKTVEGALGGLASAMAAAALFWQLFGWPGNLLAAAGYGVLTFVCSLFGDLIESIMKRDAGLKDSGNLIPGHGGLLDRFDSYMFSGAVAYFYITQLLPRFGLV